MCTLELKHQTLAQPTSNDKAKEAHPVAVHLVL